MKHNFFEKFRNLKLRTKFLFSFVLVIFFSLSMMSLINYLVFTNFLKETSNNSSKQLLDQVSLNFEQKISDIEDTSFLEYKNADFCSNMVKPDLLPVQKILMGQSIQQFLYRMVYHYDETEYAMIYGANNDLYVQRRIGSELILDVEEIDAEVSLLDNKRGQTVWEPLNKDFMVVKRAMYDINSQAYCGILVMGIETKPFKDIFDSRLSQDYGELMYINADNQLTIYNNETSKKAFQASKNANMNEFIYDHHQYILTKSETTDRRWTLLNIVSFDKLTSPLKSLRYWITMTFITAFLFAFMNAAFLSKYITNRLSKFINSMKSLSIGGLGTVKGSYPHDEIGLLTYKYNSMVLQIKDLIATLSQEKEQKQHAQYKQLEFQYKALQAQMNPHFLYNTLESIHSLAKIKDEQEIARMIYLLGKLMRGSISRKDNFVTLSEEIEFIKDYLTLEIIMYEERLQVEYELDEEVLSSIVPRFILQPILENSIVHGIEKKPGKGLIVIRCYLKEQNLVMEVEDNGAGMSAESVNSLLIDEDGNSSSNERTRVGVKSVHKRLQILFGEEYGVTIESKENIGTKVTILQPNTTKKGELLHELESSGD